MKPYPPFYNNALCATPHKEGMSHLAPTRGKQVEQAGHRRRWCRSIPVTRYGESIRQPQVAFVITSNNDRLDVLKTEKIFAHPTGGIIPATQYRGSG